VKDMFKSFRGNVILQHPLIPISLFVNICNNFFKNPKVFKKTAVIHDTKEKVKKEYWKMTDGIGRIFGGNSYGVGGYVPQRHEAKEEEVAQQQVAQPEAKPVDEETVMKFLEANNLRIVPKTVKPVELDPEAEERIAGYMEKFEELYGLIEQEFGPELAPAVVDLVMDRLMGMM